MSSTSARVGKVLPTTENRGLKSARVGRCTPLVLLVNEFFRGGECKPQKKTCCSSQQVGKMCYTVVLNSLCRKVLLIPRVGVECEFVGLVPPSDVDVGIPAHVKVISLNITAIVIANVHQRNDL